MIRDLKGLGQSFTPTSPRSSRLGSFTQGLLHSGVILSLARLSFIVTMNTSDKDISTDKIKPGIEAT